MEIWRTIVDFPDYQISSMGRIKSMPRMCAAGKRMLSPRVMRFRDNNDGYQLVNLRLDGIQVTKAVHRLVAKAFLLEAHTDETVNHENGIRNDNRAENLTWMTLQENIQHAQDNDYAIAYQES